MTYPEEEYLQLSGLQHFAFCRRQWALIHIEHQWAENVRTVDGSLLHENAHDSHFREKRGDVVLIRALRVASSRLGVSGECDVVEFHKCSHGVPIQGMEGNYSVLPVEYKRGEPKESDCDRLQLCAQALCLEEILCCDVPVGALYYHEIRRREIVPIDNALRATTEATIQEMHDLFDRHYTPKCKRRKSCNACSLRDICLPEICGNWQASDYLADMLKGDVP